MTENKTRVLARANARELDQTEIDAVSGGRMKLATWCGGPGSAFDDGPADVP